jgi:hypothetical protein
LKDGAESIGGGVTIDDKGFLEVWLSENRGGAYHINKSIKCSFMFIIPVESAALGAVGNERVEWGGEHTEVLNVHAVEVEKAEKGA